MYTPIPTPTPSPAPAPAINPKALIAEAVRWAVPYIVAFVIAIGVKVHYHVDPTVAYAYVTGGVGTVLTFVAHWLEAKFPGLNRLLGAKRPVSITK
jgi:hypothetical protein